VEAAGIALVAMASLLRSMTLSDGPYKTFDRPQLPA